MENRRVKFLIIWAIVGVMKVRFGSYNEGTIVGFTIFWSACILVLTFCVTEYDIECSSNFLLVVFILCSNVIKITTSKTLRISEFRFVTISTQKIEFLWFYILEFIGLSLIQFFILFIIFPLELPKPMSSSLS